MVDMFLGCFRHAGHDHFRRMKTENHKRQERNQLKWRNWRVYHRCKLRNIKNCNAKHRESTTTAQHSAPLLAFCCYLKNAFIIFASFYCLKFMKREIKLHWNDSTRCRKNLSTTTTANLTRLRSLEREKIVKQENRKDWEITEWKSGNWHQSA